MTLAWTREYPTKTGMYLRTTTWGRIAGIVQIYSIDSVLNGTCGEGGGLMRIAKTSPDFFWYGPIPRPPNEAEQNSYILVTAQDTEEGG